MPIPTDSTLRKEDLLARLSTVATAADLQQVEKYYLGRAGVITAELKGLKDVPEADRPAAAAAVQAWKAEVEEELGRFGVRFAAAAWDEAMKSETTDPTAVPPRAEFGAYHPLTLTCRHLTEVFSRLGFVTLDGFEAELDAFNFEALNIDRHHPARDGADTFYLNDPRTGARSESLLLRTHTSPGQVRSLLKFGAPLRAVIPGRVYRNEATDESHDYIFHQLEGLYVDRNVSVANLIATMDLMIKELFGQEAVFRLRPNYFPFVEPGFEVDMAYKRANGQEKWMEILGCGMIHPSVLQAAGLDPEEYSGFAFGLGLTRLCMLQYGLPDVRLLLGGGAALSGQFPQR